MLAIFTYSTYRKLINTVIRSMNTFWRNRDTIFFYLGQEYLWRNRDTIFFYLGQEYLTAKVVLDFSCLALPFPYSPLVWYNIKVCLQDKGMRKLDMCFWNTDAPGSNKVKIWQKSLSPIFWPRPTPGAWDVSEVWGTLRWTYSPSLFTVSSPKL